MRMVLISRPGNIKEQGYVTNRGRPSLISFIIVIKAIVFPEIPSATTFSVIAGIVLVCVQ